MALVACPKPFSVSSLLHNYRPRFISTSIFHWSALNDCSPLLPYQCFWEPSNVLISFLVPYHSNGLVWKTLKPNFHSKPNDYFLFLEKDPYLRVLRETLIMSTFKIIYFFVVVFFNQHRPQQYPFPGLSHGHSRLEGSRGEECFDGQSSLTFSAKRWKRCFRNRSTSANQTERNWRQNLALKTLR